MSLILLGAEYRQAADRHEQLSTAAMAYWLVLLLTVPATYWLLGRHARPITRAWPGAGLRFFWLIPGHCPGRKSPFTHSRMSIEHPPAFKMSSIARRPTPASAGEFWIVASRVCHPARRLGQRCPC